MTSIILPTTISNLQIKFSSLADDAAGATCFFGNEDEVAVNGDVVEALSAWANTDCFCSYVKGYPPIGVIIYGFQPDYK